MEVKKFEVEVPFGQIVYAALPTDDDDYEKLNVTTCKIVGANVRLSEDAFAPVKQIDFAEVLDGEWKGEIINDISQDADETIYTLFDEKWQAQEIVDDANGE